VPNAILEVFRTVYRGRPEIFWPVFLNLRFSPDRRSVRFIARDRVRGRRTGAHRLLYRDTPHGRRSSVPSRLHLFVPVRGAWLSDVPLPRDVHQRVRRGRDDMVRLGRVHFVQRTRPPTTTAHPTRRRIYRLEKRCVINPQKQNNNKRKRISRRVKQIPDRLSCNDRAGRSPSGRSLFAQFSTGDSSSPAVVCSVL